MELFLAAIVQNDLAKAQQLLSRNPSLANQRVAKPRLHKTKILHWLYSGDTALHLAAAGHRTELVKILIAHGADPNAAHNHRRSSPLHYAADGCIGNPQYNPKQQLQTIRALLKAGAKINAQDKNGATPLHRAVRTRSAAAVKLLLQHGAQPTIKNKPGSPPFHLAVQNTGRGGSGSFAAHEAQTQIIEMFLAAGISPHLEDGKGKTVLDSARSDWIRDLLSK